MFNYQVPIISQAYYTFNIYGFLEMNFYHFLSFYTLFSIEVEFLNLTESRAWIDFLANNLNKYKFDEIEPSIMTENLTFRKPLEMLFKSIICHDQE